MRWKSLAVGIVALLAVPFTAQAASTPKQQLHWFAGAVASASSSSVSVNVLWTGKHDTQLDGKTVSVAIDSSTQIVFGKGQTGIDPGDLVRVRATATDSTLATLTAKLIHVNCNCHWIAGTVGSVGSSSIVVHAARTGPYDRVLNGHDVTLQVNSSTIYIEGKAKTPITLGDLKAGDRVGVVFGASGFFNDPNFNPETATFTAKRVHYWPGKATPSAASDSDLAAGTSP